MDLKKFTTEDEVNEERLRRQAEWERVRKPSDPLEAPSEVFDNRTLYDKLKEQHEIKKKAFEDEHAMKNQIRGIDAEEAGFLDEIDRVKMKQDMMKKMEEKKEIEEYKKAIEQEKKTNHPAPKIHVTLQKKDKSQSELLSKVVIAKRKKNEDEDPNENKRCKSQQAQQVIVKQKIITAILPGVGEYNSNSSSSSDYSSDDEIIHRTAIDTSSLFTTGASATSADHSVSEASKTH